MNLEEYRRVFATGSLVLILIVAAPALGLIMPFPGGGERFSELWLLGPTRMAEDYPFNVTVGEEKQVFLGIGNHMGRSTYYVVYVKLRNQTQGAPNSTTATPSSLAPLYEFRAVVSDGETWEVPVFFSFLDASRFGESCVVKRISINGVVFPVDSFSLWDVEYKGFFYQLFFELWIFDESGSSFQYHNRFVGLWLNMTG
ncbi:MAG: DUF1616 domain-containing protein [Candidatus Bathyarchaeota archaeon]|nr:DUF1616 domain-containing protein [Candidatus Bathyarchaeota archaeon]